MTSLHVSLQERNSVVLVCELFSQPWLNNQLVNVEVVPFCVLSLFVRDEFGICWCVPGWPDVNVSNVLVVRVALCLKNDSHILSDAHVGSVGVPCLCCVAF